MKQEEKDYYKKLLNSRRWRALRRAVLEREPFCRDCKRDGVHTPATEVHHIRPVLSTRNRFDMELRAFDALNVVPLCHDCHVRRHTRLGKGTAKETTRRNREETENFIKKFYSETPGG